MEFEEAETNKYSDCMSIKQFQNIFVEYKKDRLTATYIKKGLVWNDVAAIQGTRPISEDNLLFYFEIRILKLPPNNEIVIGLTEDSFPQNKLPGTTTKGGFSIGYSSKGIIFCKKEPIEKSVECAQDDVVGCGFDLYNREVFFTRNSIKYPLHYAITEDFKKNPNIQLFPTCGIKGLGTSIIFNFGAADSPKFNFDIKNEAKDLIVRIQKEQEKKDISVVNLNKLVMNYLAYNCHIKTLLSFRNDLSFDESLDSLLKSSEVNFDKVAQPWPADKMDGEKPSRKFTEDFMSLERSARLESIDLGGFHETLIRKMSNASGIKESETILDDLELSKMVAEILPNDIESIEERTVFKDMIDNDDYKGIRQLIDLKPTSSKKLDVLFQVKFTEILHSLETEQYQDNNFDLINILRTDLPKDSVSRNIVIIDIETQEELEIPFKRAFSKLVMSGYSPYSLDRESLKKCLWSCLNSYLLEENGYFEKSSLEVLLNHFEFLKSALQNHKLHPKINHN